MAGLDPATPRSSGKSDQRSATRIGRDMKTSAGDLPRNPDIARMDPVAQLEHAIAAGAGANRHRGRAAEVADVDHILSREAGDRHAGQLRQRTLKCRSETVGIR